MMVFYKVLVLFYYMSSGSEKVTMDGPLPNIPASIP